MNVKHRFVIQHRSGHFITAKYDPVRDFDNAVRFKTREEAEFFFTESFYRTDKPEEYRVRVIRIQEELEEERDEQSAVIHEDDKCHGRSRPT